MIFFTLNTHHDFAVLEVGSDADKNFEGIGVDHFAFKLHGGMAGLREAKDELERADV